jgi:hypothetical protein
VATPLQVYVGGTPASILYQGSAGFPGVDQINIIIPASISNGCWISLAAVSGGVLGNIATIPVNGVGGACVDTVNGLTGNQLTSTGSQALRTGLVAIQANTTGNKPVSNVAGGTFVAYSGLYSPNQPVSPGGCIVDYLQPATIGSITGLDPGTLTLTGPNGLSLTVPPSPLGLGMFASTLSATAIPDTGGTFTFTGSGGADVGPFTSVLTFSNPLLSWTNPGIAATIDRSQNLTATWTGGNPGSYVYVTGVSTSKATSTAPSVSLGFTCLISASDGQVTVPSYILSALPPGSGGMGMQNDIYMPLTASGIDIGVALGEIGFSATATFR